jgi:parvulin-like peptidyl-prolyl isomerase
MNWKKIKKFLITHKKKIIIAGILIIGFFALMTIFTYAVEINSPFIKKIQSIFPMPAAIVGNSWISINDVEKNVNSVRRFYENQNFAEIGIRIDFETTEGKERLNLQRQDVLSKMVEDKIIEKIAKDYNISVSDEVVKSEIERAKKEGRGEAEIEAELKKLYGWTLDDFGEKVIKVELLQQQVEDRFQEENPITEDQRQKAEKALGDLNNGRLFEEVAKEYSEGVTREKGGALGWFKSGQLVESVNQVAFSIEPNQVSGIIESPFGLHIIKITDTRELENGEKIVYVNQIIIKKKQFIELVEEKMDETFIKVPLINYQWSKDNHQVEYTNKKENIVVEDEKQ